MERAASGPGTRFEGTILVVDDDSAVPQVACRVLDRGGFRALPALGGSEALRVAADRDGRIDLLLTDVVMPEMTGRELADTVAELYPGVRILFMSGYPDDETLLAGLNTTEVDFIPKPFTVEGLRDKVRTVLAR